MKKVIWVTLTVILSLTVLIGVPLMFPQAQVSFSNSPLSISLGLNEVQAQTTLSANITYPPSIDTTAEKLAAVYNLIEQLRVERNRIYGVTHKNKVSIEKYVTTGIFETYDQLFEKKQKSLLLERNNLMEDLRHQYYTDEEWKKLTLEELDQAYDFLYGNKDTAKQVTTEATTPLINELKAIDIDNIAATPLTDPYEDFTTYTEGDTGSFISYDANTINYTAQPRNADNFMAIDKGVGHFDGDFTHIFEAYHDADSGYGIVCHYLMSNATDDYYGLQTGSESALASYFYGSGPIIRLSEIYNGNVYVDDYSSALDTLYHFEFERDVDAGTYGTIYERIYADDAGDPGSLLDTLSRALHEDNDFRYFYANNSYNSGNANTQTGHMQNYDLQEAAAEPSISSNVSSEDLGTNWMNKTVYAKGSAPNNPVVDADCTFALTNDGSVTCNVTVSMSDMTGNITWAPVSGTPSTNEFRMTIYKAGDDPGNDGIVLGNDAVSFLEGMPASNVTNWDFKFELGEWVNGDVAQRSGTLQLTAVTP